MDDINQVMDGMDLCITEYSIVIHDNTFQVSIVQEGGFTSCIAYLIGYIMIYNIFAVMSGPAIQA